MNKLPIYEIFIENDENFLGLALVDDPAIEKDFIYFAEEKEQMTFNDEKMIVKGPALIPNKLIYRNDKFGERYVYFSEETIVSFVEFLMDKKENKFNLGHTDNYLNATMIESYFAVEPNEFKVPKNSWIVSLKVKDQEAWDKIKSGEFNGFSVQGIFSNELINKFSKETNMNLELKEKIMKAINTILFADEAVVEPVVEAIVEPVIEVVEPIVEPIVEEPVIEIVAEVEPEPVVDPNVALIAKMAEMITDLKNELNAKIEKYGEQPIVVEPKVETIDNNGVKSFDNPAAKYFPKNK